MILLKCLWFILPAGFANMTPTFAKRIFSSLNLPIDFNKTFLDKPIFGKHKTWRGLITGTIVGVIIFTIQKWLYQFPSFEKISLLNYREYSLVFGFLLGFGALFGDLVKSFFKRRFNIPPGKSWFPFDQVDWVIGALLFSYSLYIPSREIVLILILFFGLIVHPLSNYIGFLLKIKENKF